MKIALVTGAGRGIGQGLVQALSGNDYFAYAGTRSGQSGPKLKNGRYITLDVQSDESIAGAVEQIKREHGKLDVLINNAGIIAVPPHNRDPVSGLDKIDRHDMLMLMDVNAISPLMVAKYAVPIMTGPHCFIINISSDRSSYRIPDTKGNYGYAASKIALNMITHCLLHDLPPNIVTFAVHPGWVKTDMNARGIIRPLESAQKIIKIMYNWQPELNGHFLDNDGSLFDQ